MNKGSGLRAFCYVTYFMELAIPMSGINYFSNREVLKYPHHCNAESITAMQTFAT